MLCLLIKRKKNKVWFAFIATLIFPISSYSAEFNSSFLLGDAASQNWSSPVQNIAAGVYYFDIYVNAEWKGKFTVRISKSNILQISHSDVKKLGIDGKDKITKHLSEKAWVDLASLARDGTTVLNSGSLSVDITLPQAYVVKKDARWIDPSLWDQGINGLYSLYTLSYYHAWRKDGISDTDNIFLTLTSGINLAGWHLIDKSMYQKYRSRPNGFWTNNERYIERSVPSLKSVVRAGTSNTGSDVFDNLRFQGITLSQEQRMYPDQYRTYMPIIRGIAKSNAAVRVYQNGSIIYQINVPPGPFEITDLMPTGSRSDLNVIVQNDNGTTESFTVLYSTVADMLRSGTSQWLFNAGKANIKNVNSHPTFIQGNVSHGLNNYLTIYSGGTLSNNYQSVLAGSAFSFPWIGSFSANADMAKADLDDGSNLYGQRYKLAWSKYLSGGTNLTLATYYFDTQNYLSFYDSIKLNALIAKGNSSDVYRRSKRRFNVNLSQPLADGWGKLTLQGNWTTYWNTTQKNREYSLTYNNMWRDISYSLALTRTQYDYDYNTSNSSYEYDGTAYGKTRYSDNRISVSVTVPFSMFDRRASLTSSIAMENRKYSTMNTGFNGTTKTLDYSINLADNHASDYRSGSIYAGWKTPYSKLTGTYTEASYYRQLGATVSGMALLWREGILFSGDTGNTFVILDAPGVAGATVNGNPAMRTNGKGRVLVPSAAAYRSNNFRLSDSNAIGADNAEILGNIGYTAPWFGSISYIKYKTDTRRVFVYIAEFSNGAKLPFGASILDKNYQATGYVAQGSQLYVKADAPPEKLYIRYMDDKTNQEMTCVIDRPDSSENALNNCRNK